MKLWTAALLLTAGATVAFAHGGVTNPAVKARMDLMVTVKDAAGVLGAMAKGSVPYNAAAAEQARATLITAGEQIAPSFEAQEMDAKTEALPAIWKKWTDFTKKADAMTVAAQSMDTASAEMIAAGMAGLGKTCRACHKMYRVEK